MTGYGQEGPLSSRAGHDINYLAISGALVADRTRRASARCPRSTSSETSAAGRCSCVVGVLAALRAASISGVGQVVDAAMVDGSASLLTQTHAFLNVGFWKETRGVNILDSGAPFYEVYETSDERFVAVGAIEAKFFAALLEGLGLAVDDLPAQMDRERWPEVKERFARIFATKTRDEWEEVFDGLDACVSPVLSPREAATHPFNAARRRVLDRRRHPAAPRAAVLGHARGDRPASARRRVGYPRGTRAMGRRRVALRPTT